MTNTLLSSAPIRHLDLIVRVQQGDEAAFSSLAEKYDGMLNLFIRAASRVTDPDNARNRMIAVLWIAAKEYNPERGAQFSTWLWHQLRGEATRIHREASRINREPLLPQYDSDSEGSEIIDVPDNGETDPLDMMYLAEVYKVLWRHSSSISLLYPLPRSIGPSVIRAAIEAGRALMESGVLET